MFPVVSGSEGSIGTSSNLATLQPHLGLVEPIIWLHLSKRWTLGGNTLLTPPVADTKSIGHVHSECITSLHDASNMTHHTHSM